MQTLGNSAMECLLGFNQQVIDQALAVVGEHATPDAQHSAPPFAGPVGAHMRHVVEHYEALVNGLTLGVNMKDIIKNGRDISVANRTVRLEYARAF